MDQEGVFLTTPLERGSADRETGSSPPAIPVIGGRGRARWPLPPLFHLGERRTKGRLPLTIPLDRVPRKFYLLLRGEIKG